MMQFAIVRGIDKDAAQDFVMESICRVIDTFDPERGELLHFGYRVLGNRIKNHFRDTHATTRLTHDVADGTPTQFDHFVRQEEEKRAATILSSLRGKIGREEMELLNVLQAQMEQDGSYNVSAAARVVGIEPLKAHDILRKMKRKLSAITSDLVAAEERADLTIRRIEEAVTVREEVMMPSRLSYESASDGRIEKIRYVTHDEEFTSLLTDTLGIAMFGRIAEYMEKKK